jgi:hypothetical protein
MDVKNSMVLQAQKEVRAHTHDFLVLPVVAYFDNVYGQTQRKDGKLATFQKELREIPNWPLLRVQSVLHTIQLSCDFLPQLISAMFLGHIKVLASIKISKAPNVKVKVPKQEKFVHALFIETARRFYENPHVFRKGDHGAKTAVVMEAIDATIRKFLPLRDILSAYLVKSKGAPEEEEEEDLLDEEDDDEEDPEEGTEDVDDVFDDDSQEGDVGPPVMNDTMDIADLARATPVPSLMGGHATPTPRPSGTEKMPTPTPRPGAQKTPTPKPQEKTIAIADEAPPAAKAKTAPSFFDDSDIEENV